ncbi:MAG TPA: PHP domain-containing protein [Defluviitaleaceae bacterium]|jgi:predicted metal-dependent phosphoesterase TrpH|nr:PHP domain-containing protein [Candidatus Epulonipiscium sp.]HOA80389.1 PHP domain-containing protein [Defluviitaleaceae bacterium]
MIEKVADLHIHSYYSDGTMSPKDILSTALEKGVGLLAIADHNVLEGSKELEKISKGYDIGFISAVELDSLYKGEDIHILGYGVNLYDDVFYKFVKRNRFLLDEISVKLIKKMQEDFNNISLQDFLSFNYDNKKGGWKALHYFMEKGITKSLREGFELYPKYNCSYDCVDFPSVKEVCKYIHNAGGKAVLAHPGETIKERDMTIFKKRIESLIDFGIDGMECYYPTHTKEITKICLDICKDRGLLITAGSDCHGDFGNAKIGEMNIPVTNLYLGDLLKS